MHEIAVTPTVTIILLKLPARGFTEISHRRKISNNGATRVESTLKSLQGGGRLVFLLELHIDVANHVVSEIIADVEALDLPEFAKFFEDVFVEVLEVLLDLAGVDGLALGVDAWGDHVRTLIHVGQKEGWGDCGPVVKARAAIPMPASPDLEVEWAVHAVLLCAENRSQVLRHDMLFVRVFGLIFLEGKLKYNL